MKHKKIRLNGAKYYHEQALKLEREEFIGTIKKVRVDEEECMCSDRGCPCGGNKKGRL